MNKVPWWLVWVLCILVMGAAIVTGMLMGDMYWVFRCAFGV